MLLVISHIAPGPVMGKPLMECTTREVYWLYHEAIKFNTKFKVL